MELDGFREPKVIPEEGGTEIRTRLAVDGENRAITGDYAAETMPSAIRFRAPAFCFAGSGRPASRRGYTASVALALAT